MSNSSNTDDLGVSWEIGVIVAIILVVVAIVAAVIFQQRRRRRLASALRHDLERQQNRRHSSSSLTMLEEEKPREELKHMTESAANRITKPSPALSSKRSSRTDSLLDPRPSKYYWDHRRS